MLALSASASEECSRPVTYQFLKCCKTRHFLATNDSVSVVLSESGHWVSSTNQNAHHTTVPHNLFTGFQLSIDPFCSCTKEPNLVFDHQFQWALQLLTSNQVIYKDDLIYCVSDTHNCNLNWNHLHPKTREAKWPKHLNRNWLLKMQTSSLNIKEKAFKSPHLTPKTLNE